MQRLVRQKMNIIYQNISVFLFLLSGLFIGLYLQSKIDKLKSLHREDCGDRNRGSDDPLPMGKPEPENHGKPSR